LSIKTIEMGRFNAVVTMLNHGRYSTWDRQSRGLPEIMEITDSVPCVAGVEFGYILNIKKAKGKLIRFCINHPHFLSRDGSVEPPFEGTTLITSNNYDFYLGDSVWEPVADKCGFWTLTTWVDGVLVAEKSICVSGKKNDDLGIDW